MNIYVTKETAKRLKLPAVSEPSAAEECDLLMSWGAKLYYFNRRKCIQLVNYETRLTIVLDDLRAQKSAAIPDLLMASLQELFKGDQEMLTCLERMEKEGPVRYGTPIRNRKILSSIVFNETTFLARDVIPKGFVQEGALLTRELNWYLNMQHLFAETIHESGMVSNPGEKFRKRMVERFGEKGEN